jgi:hypothetical protein
MVAVRVFVRYSVLNGSMRIGTSRLDRRESEAMWHGEEDPLGAEC